MITITAKKFYKEIEKQKDIYKLVNGLFIVKYLDSKECIYIGEFLKANNPLNPTNTNRVRLNQKNNQRFIKSKKIMTSTLGIWRKMNISFEESDIKEILKG